MMTSDQEWLDAWGEVAKEIEESEQSTQCTCDSLEMFHKGCQCGAFKEEKRREEEERKEKVKQNIKDLNKGISYEERVKKYGYISEFSED